MPERHPLATHDPQVEEAIDDTFRAFERLIQGCKTLYLLLTQETYVRWVDRQHREPATMLAYILVWQPVDQYAVRMVYTTLEGGAQAWVCDEADVDVAQWRYWLPPLKAPED